MTNLIFLSIGSNIGDRLKNIKLSLLYLEETRELNILNCSRFISSSLNFISSIFFVIIGDARLTNKQINENITHTIMQDC